MIGPTCPKCGHVSHPTQAMGRFLPEPFGYRASYDNAPRRDTREEAEADMCRWRTNPRGRW